MGIVHVVSGIIFQSSMFKSLPCWKYTEVFHHRSPMVDCLRTQLLGQLYKMIILVIILIFDQNNYKNDCIKWSFL